MRTLLRGTATAFALGTGLLAAGRPAAAADATAWIDALHLRPGVPLVALPPEAGAVIAVDERRTTDRYVQTVILRGDPGTVGENQVTVTVTRDGLAPRIDNDALSAEAAERLPAMAMTLGPAEARDGLGGFGSAVGRSGALACLYGWQAVDLADRWISGDQPSVFQERHALSLRVRLCRTDTTPAALLATMTGLRSAIGSEPAAPRQTTAADTAAADATAAALDLHQIGSAGPTVPQPSHRPAHARPRPIRTVRVALVRRAVRPSRVPDEAPVALAGMPQVPLPK